MDLGPPLVAVPPVMARRWGERWRWLGWWVICAAALFVLAPPRTVERWLPPTTVSLALPFGHWGGFAYAAAAPAGVVSDAELTPRASPLALFENGESLAPPHTQHDQIQRLGRGAYSHWRGTVVFSASDNSDPNLNDRAYTARYPASAPLAALVALYPLAAAPLVLLLAGLTPRVRAAASRAS